MHINVICHIIGNMVCSPIQLFCISLSDISDLLPKLNANHNNTSNQWNFQIMFTWFFPDLHSTKTHSKLWKILTANELPWAHYKARTDGFSNSNPELSPLGHTDSELYSLSFFTPVWRALPHQEKQKYLREKKGKGAFWATKLCFLHLIFAKKSYPLRITLFNQILMLQAETYYDVRILLSSF